MRKITFKLKKIFIFVVMIFSTLLTSCTSKNSISYYLPEEQIISVTRVRAYYDEKDIFIEEEILLDEAKIEIFESNIKEIKFKKVKPFLGIRCKCLKENPIEYVIKYEKHEARIGAGHYQLSGENGGIYLIQFKKLKPSDIFDKIDTLFIDSE